jgi:hypothetical protein
MTDHESVEALKVSDEYRALGVLGRERLLWARFPGLRERHRAESAKRRTAAVYGPRPDASATRKESQ